MALHTRPSEARPVPAPAGEAEGAGARPGADDESDGHGQGGTPAELISAVSHELRQPLASIRGFSEMLLLHWADFADQDKLDMVGEILHEAKRVGRLVDELLDASRLEQGHLALNLHPTDIGHVVGRALRNLQPLFPDLEAEVDCPAGLPFVVADQYKLEQVVANIVENACKHGSPTGLRVVASAVPAVPAAPATGAGPGSGAGTSDGGQAGDVSEVGEGGALVLTVTDTGPGIAASDLPRVTEKFFRAADAATAGLGLGLWISQGIVEAHGGRLEATSAEGGGTTVRVTIPLQGPARSGKLAGS